MFAGIIAAVVATQAADLFVAGSMVAITIYEAAKNKQFSFNKEVVLWNGFLQV